MRRILLSSAFLVLSALILSACAEQVDGEPMVTGAWVRTAPPTAEVLAGYMTLSNLSSNEVRVIAAQSPQFERVEFHHMDMKNGQMLMREMAGIVAPAKQRAVLKPSSDHLMLIGPKQPLQRGDRVEVVLTLDGETSQNTLSVTFMVRDRAPQAAK